MKHINFDTKTTILSNGLKLITIKKDTQISSINIGIKIGSINENETEKGISHFVEHMLFKGTKKYNNEELNNALENLGGEYNAYTDYSSTVYSINCLEEEIENGIKLLAEMLINSEFVEEEFEKEKSVILAEIRTSKDDIEDLSFKRVNELAFNASPLRYDVSGTEETVSQFTCEEVYKFYKENYTPDNVVISLVTSKEHDVAVEIIKAYFDGWSGKRRKSNNIVLEKNIPATHITTKADLEQCTITFLYTFYDLKSTEELPLKILNHKFGDSANSILFRELREKRGLAYDIYTHLDLTKNIKCLYIYTSVAEEDYKETIEVIYDCISKVKNKDILFDDGTLALMKKVHKTAVISTLEDSGDLANYVLHQSLEDEDIMEFIVDMDRLDSIKSEHIYEVAKKVLNNPTIHILMPEGDEEVDE